MFPRLRRHASQQNGHPQQIETDEMMQQKIDYIHNNPVARGMVVGAEHCCYSYAREWLADGHPLF